MVTYVTVTTYVDMDLNPGTYNYMVKAVYDEGTSGPSNTATVTIANPPGYEFCDDFESYTVGMQLAEQNSVDWTTWSNAPGGTEDPFVVTNGNKVIEVMPNNDLVHVIDNFRYRFLYHFIRHVHSNGFCWLFQHPPGFCRRKQPMGHAGILWQ